VHDIESSRLMSAVEHFNTDKFRYRHSLVLISPRSSMLYPSAFSLVRVRDMASQGSHQPSQVSNKAGAVLLAHLLYTTYFNFQGS